ncbi:unnamed protein product [Callosobruchus maculatus]|uniref:Nuclear speckle splicing regulatory protein 1 N-terminal domain-containing protein n=1 Tax=Callosobruchus maculatus TaxID=64391 RepID=A0A653DWB3_CALMS|nr:unnamed protein product [Callosobruchus maculatus]
MAKQYGLIMPNKSGHQIGKVTTNKPSIFEEESDSDSSEVKPTGIPKSLKKQDKLNQNKALEEDPTVYQYDEVYDEIDKKRKETKLARKDIDKKPKYINRLLAAAEKRKRENERRIERQVQKEREEEGEMFKDKESFITSAYKKKLEEMKALEEQEKREEYLESIGDVRKQGNLDGFYRHLYEQKVKYEDITDEVKQEVKEEAKSDSEAMEREQESDCETSPKTCNKSSDHDTEMETTIKTKKDLKNRKYRKRRDSKESEDSADDRKEHLVSNLDADSDFSIDSSDSEDDNEKVPSEKKQDNIKVTAIADKTPEKTKDVDETKTNEDNVVQQTDKRKREIDIKEESVEVKPKKPKVDIWKKRTVGEKFDEALKRYFERKSLRQVQRGN